MPKLHVILSDDRCRFLAYGGQPGGRDAVHRAVVQWPGWRRLRQAGKIPKLIGSEGTGASCSIFGAPVSPVTVSSLLTWTQGMAWSPDAYETAKRVNAALRNARGALEVKPTHAHLTPPGSDRTPMTHQLQALQAIRYLGPQVLLADDMGLGKTSTALWALKEAFGLTEFRCLVVCPASVKFNWQKEIWATLGVWAMVIDGTAKQRGDQLADIRHTADLKIEGGFVIINYDLLIKLGEMGLATLRNWVEKGALICDESYYLKNRKSQRYQVIHEHFAPQEGGAWARLMLSGTPIRNRIDDLYAQIELMKPGTWTSYTDFCERHLDRVLVQFGKDKIQGGKVVKAKKHMKVKGIKNLDKLNLVVNTLQIRRKKEDVLDLPPKVHTFPELRLDGPHFDVYKAMKEWAILELDELDDSENIFSPQAASAMVSAMRCEQIAQGFVGGIPDPMMRKLSTAVLRSACCIPGRPNELVFPDSPKMAWLLETIETLWLQDCRPVVFSRFNAPLIWLRHKFDKDSFILHGGQSVVFRQDIIDGFQAGERRLMFCQVKIAEGFNLTSSTDELFLSRDWSPAVNAQAEDRCHRIGQKGTVNIQIPIVTNTVEKMIHKRLANKADSAAAALRSMTVAELREAL